MKKLINKQWTKHIQDTSVTTLSVAPYESKILLLYLRLAQGMPYNYVVGHDNSTSLADAPPPIKEAMRRMTWAAKRVVPDKDFIAFNELLAIGYLEDMKMGVRSLTTLILSMLSFD